MAPLLLEPGSAGGFVLLKVGFSFPLSPCSSARSQVYFLVKAIFVMNSENNNSLQHDHFKGFKVSNRN